MVGSTICWLTAGGDILELDLDTETVAPVISRPRCLPLTWDFQILPMENNRLGFAIVTILLRLQIWQWEASSGSDSVFRWVLQREIRLDKLLSPPPPPPSVGRIRSKILGIAEDANAVFVSWDGAAFMIQLESLQVMKIPESATGYGYYSYTSFFTAGKT